MALAPDVQRSGHSHLHIHGKRLYSIDLGLAACAAGVPSAIRRYSCRAGVMFRPGCPAAARGIQSACPPERRGA